MIIIIVVSHLTTHVNFGELLFRLKKEIPYNYFQNLYGLSTIQLDCCCPFLKALRVTITDS